MLRVVAALCLVAGFVGLLVAFYLRDVSPSAVPLAREPAVADVAAGAFARLTPEVRADEVLYDSEADRTTVHVQGATLRSVLLRLAERAGFEMSLPDTASLDSQISIEFEGLSLAAAIERLLEGHDKAIFYAPGEGDGLRIARVIVAASDFAQTGEGPAATVTVDSSAPPGHVFQSSVDSIEALLSDDPARRRQALDALEDASEAERKDAARELIAAAVVGVPVSPDALGEALDALGPELDDLAESDPGAGQARQLSEQLLDALMNGKTDAYYASLDALTRLDPALAAGTLSDLVDDPRVSSRVRGLAAQGLGVVGDEAGVEPLAKTLDGRAPTSDDFVDDSAAMGLAQIGGADAAGSLIEAFYDGGEAERQRAALAIAMHGDPGAKALLKQLIDVGHVQDEFPADVTQELDRLSND